MRRHDSARSCWSGYLGMRGARTGEDTGQPSDGEQPKRGAGALSLVTPDEAFTCAAKSAEDFGLDVAKAARRHAVHREPGPVDQPHRGVTLRTRSLCASGS